MNCLGLEKPTGNQILTSSTAASVIALALGGGFLAAALASSALKVILLTEVRQSEHPGAFRFLMCLYWLLGLAGIGSGWRHCSEACGHEKRADIAEPTRCSEPGDGAQVDNRRSVAPGR
jgi:hypothetical protein